MDDSTDTASIPPPNYTQIPNVVLDLMPEMGEAELRVVLAIARQTFGWHKKRDKISLTQLMELTGMKKQGVVNGLKAGIKRKLIERTPDPSDARGGLWYRLLVHERDQSTKETSPQNEHVYNADQSTKETRTSPRKRLEPVSFVDTQKKDKERKEKREGGEAPPAPAFEKRPTTDPNQDHPACLLYLTLTGYRPARLNASSIAAAVATDDASLDKWRTVVEAWITSGNRYSNVRGMLDWYARGIPDRARGASPHPAVRTPLAPATKPNLPEQSISPSALAAAAAARRRSNQ